MNIYVKVSKYYDYVPTSAGDADKQMADGSFYKRIVVNQPSETTVIISDQQIENLIKSSKVLAADKEYAAATPNHKVAIEEEVVASELEKALLGQAPRDAWGKIEVHDNIKMAKYLNNYFKEQENEN